MNKIYRDYTKRILDIFISVIVMVLFFWLYAIIAILIKIKLGSPVIFKQERVGKNEKKFMLYKFRSMTNKKDKDGELLPDCVRLTKFGKVLRASSLDELPEMFNILKGEMSLIGPRPLTCDYLEYYNEIERHRHDVVPGLTGWAQVNGRTAIGWEDRFKYDVEYVENLSFILDLRIFFLTIKKVIVHEGIVEAGKQGNFDDFRKKQWSQVNEQGDRQ